MFRYILPVLLATTIISCGSDDDNDNNDALVSVGSTQFVILENSSLDFSQNQVSGTGSLLANDPLPAVSSGSSFAIAAQLEDASSISLTANSANSGNEGLSLSFSNDANTLKVVLKYGDQTVDISGAFAGKSATDISYLIDIHNDESPAHVLIWEGIESTEVEPLFNSENPDQDWEAPGNGGGSFWGVILNNAAATKLSRGEPNLEDEGE